MAQFNMIYMIYLTFNMIYLLLFFNTDYDDVGEESKLGRDFMT